MPEYSGIIIESSMQMDRIIFPELQRPDADPPTPELINWALQMYAYSLQSHFREMLRSFISLVQGGLLPASFVVGRSLFEMGAHVYYTHKHVVQFLDSGDLKNAWDLLHEINMGSRYMQEQYGGEVNSPSFSAPREIAKVIRCFDEWTAREKTKTNASDNYSFLSEFAHPNMAAFSHYYKMEVGMRGYGIVRFVDCSRESSYAPWPLISLSLVTCLHFSARLLQRSGEGKILPQIRAIFRRLAHNRGVGTETP